MPTRDTAWPTGTPGWADLSTTDPAAARDFYAELFGWDFEVGPADTGHYGTASQHGGAVAGVNGIPMADHPPVWATYLATDDAAATAAKVEAAGGRVVAPSMEVMGFGTMALVEAAGGGFFGLWQAGSHTGFSVYNEPGAVIWDEFVTRDYAAAKKFYAEAFGYAYTEIGDDASPMAMAQVGGDVVASLTVLPPQAPAQVPPHWRLYFCVADTDATVAKAEQLGGAVLQAPTEMSFGRFADLADPHGAMFSVVTPPDDPSAAG